MTTPLFTKIRQKLRDYAHHVRDRRLVSTYGRRLFTSEEMEEVIRRNRLAASSIPNWIDDDIYEGSIFHYGMPRRLRSFVNQPVNQEPTYTDVICHLQSKIKAPINYLELGVSVGKNFFQIASFLENAALTGFDIEEINPILEAQFSAKHVQSHWETGQSSMKKGNSSLTNYRMRSNLVRYLSGDIFDEKAWERLAGNKFNVIFSDAFHSSEALRIEHEMMKKYELFDRESFIIVWDDLGGEMTAAFLEIYEDLRREYDLPANSLSLNYYGGWVGQHEPKHLIGIITKF